MRREATQKQKAMLRFIGVSFSEPLELDVASSLIDQAIESRQYHEKLDQWNRKKFKLHPDLYASEMAEHQAERIDSLHGELNDSEMREFVKKVTKAEVREIVAYLDKRFPDWDDDSVKGVWDYGLAAVQQLYPDRVKRGYDLRFPDTKAAGSPLSSSGGCLSVIAVFIVTVLVIGGLAG